MPATKRRINIELLLGISATFLSLAALVVSIFQTKIAREQQQASVWPRLAISRSVLDGNFTLTIANQGVGPAIVKSVAIAYKGKRYASLGSLLLQFTGKLNGGYYVRSFDKDDVIKAEDEIDIFGLVKNDEALSLKLRDVVTDSSFHLWVHYADVYGNCWQLDQKKVTSLGKCADW